MTLGITVPVPAPPSGWFNYAYALLCDGALALIRSDRDFWTEFRNWRERWEAGNLHEPRPSLGGRLRLSKFKGAVEFGAIEVAAQDSDFANCLADGRWLVVSSRNHSSVHNGRFFNADGTPAGDFVVGDGVAHIRCAPDGSIWAGYFDEGVFSGSDIGNPANSGVARFGPDGRFLWGLNRIAGEDVFVADCYALTMDANTAWCCAYTDFPIVRIREGNIDRWSNQVSGAKAMAVDGDHVLLAGGYKDNADRLALLRLGDGRAHHVGETRFRPPGQGAAPLLQGQGSAIHIVGEQGWTRISVAEVLSVLSVSNSR